jgi:hypothetical protein
MRGSIESAAGRPAAGARDGPHGYRRCGPSLPEWSDSRRAVRYSLSLPCSVRFYPHSQPRITTYPFYSRRVWIHEGKLWRSRRCLTGRSGINAVYVHSQVCMMIRPLSTLGTASVHEGETPWCVRR